jgi:ATPase subunit of ABC transporter with duplicated ATPase domains
MKQMAASAGTGSALRPADAAEEPSVPGTARIGLWGAPGSGKTTFLAALFLAAHQLMAVILHQRHELPQVAVARLFAVRPETLNRRIRETRELLNAAGHTITPAGHRLATLDDLHAYAAVNDITAAMEIKQAC